MPQAELFNEHLLYLENNNIINWVDYVARADGLGFIREDKTYHSSSPQHTTKIVRFFHMFSDKKYKKLQRNKLKIHFQYLLATDILGDYDYFSLTAGTNKL